MHFPFRRPLGAIFLCASSWASWAQPAAEPPANSAGATEPAVPAEPPTPSTWDRIGAAVNEFGTTVSDTQAWEQRGHWRIVASPYMLHYNPSDEHQPVWAIGLERQRTDDWLAGFSFFSNSFGQPSGYLYLGRRYPGLFGVEPLFFQWSAGLMYGYVDQYEEKVPANVNGFSPAAVITLGWQFNPKWSFAVHALGDAGLMFQFGYDLR